MKRKVLVGGILILTLAISGCRQKSSAITDTPLTTEVEREELLSSTNCECGTCGETLATCTCPQAEKQKKKLGLL